MQKSIESNSGIISFLAVSDISYPIYNLLSYLMKYQFKQLFLVIPLFILFAVVANNIMPKTLTFEIEKHQVAKDDLARVFWTSKRKINNRVKRKVTKYNSKTTQKITIKIHPKYKTRIVQFAPMWAEGHIVLKSINYARFGSNDLDLSKLKVISGKTKLTLTDNGLDIVSESSAPHLLVTNKLKSISPDSIIGIIVALLLCLLSAVLVTAIIQYFFRFRFRYLSSSFNSILNYYTNNKPKSYPVNWLILVISSIFVLLGGVQYLLFFDGGFSFLDVVSLLGYVVRLVIIFTLSYLLLSFILLSQRILSFSVSLLIIFLGLYYYVDSQLYTLNGMSLTHGLGILLDGGIGNFKKNLVFTGLSEKVLIFYTVLLVIGIIGVVLLLLITNHYSKKFPIELSNKKLIKLLVLGVVIVFSEQLINKSFKPRQALAKEQEMLGYTPVLPIKDYIIKYKLSQKPIVRKDLLANNANITPHKTTPVFVFIIESLREDFLTEKTAPEILAFKSDATSYHKTIASGNASHYGWFAIVNSRFPYFWENLYYKNDVIGSPVLNLLQQADYKTNVFSAKDLSYLGGLKYMNGVKSERFNLLTDRPKMPVPELDLYALNELTKYSANHSMQSTINLVFLDALHYPYRWLEGIDGLQDDFVGEPASGGVNLKAARNLAISNPDKIINRYKNSVRFTDYSFGIFIDNLKKKGLYDESIIAVVSDHGQQFMEHGYLMHGRTLYPEDIYIPMYVKFPGKAAQQNNQIASQIDLMPTILDNLGLYSENKKLFDGQSLLNNKKDFAVSSIAGLQLIPYKFSIETKDYKLRFSIDKQSPRESKNLYINSILDKNNKGFIPGSGSTADYISFLEEEFIPKLRQFSFIQNISNPTE